MPRPKRKKLDPKVLWVVTDSTRPITPTFYREELVRAVQKELPRYPGHAVKHFSVRTPLEFDARWQNAFLSGCSKPLCTRIPPS